MHVSNHQVIPKLTYGIHQQYLNKPGKLYNFQKLKKNKLVKIYFKQFRKMLSYIEETIHLKHGKILRIVKCKDYNLVSFNFL